MSNPITNTSDVWASLVANIVPLLVLVGEKHVRAYFRTMCRPSHHLLFAASPIGLVTAVTTLIRLGGAPVLKQMIGGQFEPVAQVLLDVTSVSRGQVGLEFVRENLEPSIYPTEEDKALFWVNGGKHGTGDDIVSWVIGRENNGLDRLITGYLEHTVDFVDDMEDRYIEFNLFSSLRGEGPGAVWIAREYALKLTSWRAPSIRHRAEDERVGKFGNFCAQQGSRLLGGNSPTICEGTALAVAHLTGVSPVLTASANLDSGMLDALRYTFVVFALVCNAGVVIALWFTTNNSLNTSLVAGGLLVTCTGSWLTTQLVDRASVETLLDISTFGGSTAGFVSNRNKAGLRVQSYPKFIVISHYNGISYLDKRQLQPITASVVLLMVIGYVGLYVGLRASPWWVSLSMLAIAAITASARSVLDPTSSYFERNIMRDDSTASIFWTSHEDQLIFSRNPTSPDPETAELESATPGSASVKDKAIPIHDMYEVAFAFTWQVNTSTQGPSWGVKEDVVYRDVMTHAVQLAHEMRLRKIAPLEYNYWKDRTRYPGGSGPGDPGFSFVYSDVLSSQGIWRQPLEILIPSTSTVNDDRLMHNKIITALWNVGARACMLPGCRLGDFSSTSVYVSLQALPDADEINGQVRRLDITRFKDCLLWVAAKVVFVVMADTADEKILTMGKEWFGGKREWSKDEVDRILKPFIGTGLTYEM